MCWSGGQFAATRVQRRSHRCAELDPCVRTSTSVPWTCKRAPQHAAEALECLGGSGFVEESVLPRLLRQSPVNGVWEGSGNVICLDVRRVLAREPEALEAYWSEVAQADTGNSNLARAIDDLHVDLSEFETSEALARSLVERMALIFQASFSSVLLPTSSPTHSATPGWAVPECLERSRPGPIPRRL
jgi:putative acyl-CoA dehydrogenase